MPGFTFETGIMMLIINFVGVSGDGCVETRRNARSNSLEFEMTTGPIRFHDGARYEKYMGKWSQLAGDVFLDWLAPADGQRWLDVGCGNGAFTEMLVGRHAPAWVAGIDPSAAQLAYARERAALAGVAFTQGDAMALPYENGIFDMAVMPLVIFFVVDPARGVAEMARVVRPGGVVSAYAWDMPGGGFPYEVLLAEIRGLGITVPEPPSAAASGVDALHALWVGAGLVDVETHGIEVFRTFADFDDFWSTALGAPSVGQTLGTLASGDAAQLQARLRDLLPADVAGRITYGARANAVKGRVAR